MNMDFSPVLLHLTPSELPYLLMLALVGLGVGIGIGVGYILTRDRSDH